MQMLMPLTIRCRESLFGCTDFTDYMYGLLDLSFPFSEPAVAFLDSGMASSDLDSEIFIKQFCIPSYILQPDRVANRPHNPEYPTLVFINSKSGGQLGGDLLVTYRAMLNKKQVKVLRDCFFW